jgi:hypothetical protein
MFGVLLYATVRFITHAAMPTTEMSADIVYEKGKLLRMDQ